MLVIAGDWKTAGHRLRKPAQGTAPAIGRRHSPCNRTEGMPPSNRTQGMTPCNQTQGMPPAIGHQARSPLSDANDDPTFVGNVQLQEKVHALGRLACRLPWHYTPLPSEGGAGGWVSWVVLWGWASKCKEGSRSAWPWEPSVVERGRLPTLPHCIAVPSA